MKRRPRSRVVRGRRTRAAAPAGAKGLRDLVTYIARGLVDDPGGVVVSEVKRQHAVDFELRVSPGDLGNVIGRSGRTAKAIRILLAASTIPDGAAVPNFDIVD